MEEVKLNQKQTLPRGSTPNPNASKLIFGEGDIVSLTLNLKNQTISCKINNNESFILFNDVETKKYIKWRILVCMENEGDSVSLLNFYQHS